MYTLRSHMSAVAYTCVFHRPITTNHQNHKVTTSSYHFSHITKPIHFQNNTKLESSYDTLRSLIINWLNKVRCLESIGMLKSTQKHEKRGFGVMQNWHGRVIRTHGRVMHPLQETLTRSCHLDTRSCHLTNTEKCIFTFSRIKSCFQIHFRFRFRQCIPNT
jgi:hypothetical protein